MKNVVLLMIAVFALTLAGVAGYRHFRADKKNVSLDNALSADWLMKRLSLDQDQTKAVRKLQADYTARLSAASMEHCKACCELNTVVFKSGTTNDPAVALVAAMSKAQADSELATIQHMRAIHAILRPEQKTVFEKLVIKCFETSDSNKLCHPGKDGGCGMKPGQGAEGAGNCCPGQGK
ncbi:MAG: hypothetical protein C0404_00170 [Verrucomicrobia bacterium]|nr:hypothetical protein [Verrucomicrobiota bacterium]